MSTGTEQLVWVRTGNWFTPYTTVDPSPIPGIELDEHGHLWQFDGGGSDPEAPYTCALYGEPQWRAHNAQCEPGQTLAELNEARARWIDRSRYRPEGLSGRAAEGMFVGSEAA